MKSYRVFINTEKVRFRPASLYCVASCVAKSKQEACKAVEAAYYDKDNPANDVRIHSPEGFGEKLIAIIDKQ